MAIFGHTHQAVRNILMFILGFIIASASVLLMVDAKAAPIANVVVCGYGDPNGGCAQALVDMGHIAGSEPIATPWYPADLSPFGPGMSGSTEIGLPNVVAAIDDFHARGYAVRLHGYSQGSDLALAAADVDHVEEVLLYGSPFPENGAFHGTLLDNDVVEPLLQTFGKLTTDRQIPTDTLVQAYYNEGDVWANFVPDQYDLVQTINKMNDTMAQDAHWIQPKFGATCEFTDKYGVLNHVFPDENPLTHSACDPSPLS